MPRFDRYMLSQLMMLFGFFSLVLVMVYWVNRAVLLFNHLIGDGQSIGIFLELTMLSLPNVIKIMLPLSAFAAAVYVTNRLSRESELEVMQAVGLSPARLARPVLMFGLAVALLTALLGNFLVPRSRTLLAERSAEMAQNVTAKFLTEGKFMHPADGVTLFIRQITPLGEMHDVLLSDGRKPDSRTAFSARKALLVKVDGDQKLVMFDGMAQTLTLSDRRLATTRFADFTYDLGSLIAPPGPRQRDVAELSTPMLFRADPADIARSNGSRAAFLYEANMRLSAPLTSIAAALLGFACLLLGGFSRFGNWRQIGIGAVLLILLQLLVDWSAGIGASDPRLWPMAYLPPVCGGAVALIMLWMAGRPRRIGPRRVVLGAA
ncbi:MAG: LPS export ABC transporter permease LptF [Rhodobacteraceae bacterium]|nr:LPS export ABC transporter permease LptF [Paracoccaceae bacterium]